MFGIDDLFDLNGDGKLDGVEMAFAYSVIFGSEEEQEPDSWDFDENNDDWEE
ncbi:MAG: hypothetical protein IKF60_02490 [Solobacterium sp.]|nr:hypothetical protein [Solobacterium sp.]